MKSLLLCCALAFAIAGCGSKSGSAAGGGSDAAGGGVKKENGATVVNEVPKDGSVPEGGIVLRPSNPDDPKFKPDPKLAGGGGR